MSDSPSRAPSYRRIAAAAAMVAALVGAYQVGALVQKYRRSREPAVVLSGARHVVGTEGPVRGGATAPVVMVVFSDFECPACGDAFSTLDQVVKSHGDEMRLVFRHLPLTRIHPHALPAARAAIAAERQGRFWEYHDAIFRDQASLARPGALEAWATALGLDLVRWRRDRDAEETGRRLQADVGEARRLKVPGTPTLFVNGRAFRPPFTVERLEAALREEMKAAAAAKSDERG
jgi:protein-disulfide isomerase